MIFKTACTFFLVYLSVVGTGLTVPTSNKHVHQRCNTQSNLAKKSPVVCITIPKCGTHLLMKCLSLLGDASMHYDYAKWEVAEKTLKLIRSWNKLLPPHHFKGRFDPKTFGPMPLGLAQEITGAKKRLFERHFPYTVVYNNFLDNQRAIKFLMIRDPRAMIVSLAHMIHKGFEPNQIANVESIILDLIDGRKKSYVPWGVEIHESYPVIWDIGVAEYYKTFLPFLSSKNCKLIRFEDLVGDLGGGSKQVQIDRIQEIAQHVGIVVDNQRARDIGDALFGGSGTFREGKIDGWKKYFSPTIKAAFKKAPGACELLVNLGYEKDNTW